MIQVKDRIRYIDEIHHEKYGVLVVWSVKGEYIICKRNTSNSVIFVTVKSSLVKLFVE